MDFTNRGASLYHDIAALFARTTDGHLLWATGPRSQELEASWDQLKDASTAEVCESKTDAALSVDAKGNPFSGLDLQEFQRPDNSFVVGIFTDRSCKDQTQSESDLHSRFIKQILSQSRLDILKLQTVSQGDKGMNDARSITELFSSKLRNIVEHDEWDAKGRAYFEARAHEFTRRGARVEFVLPAFPCKSSNGDKVSGVLPDKGEELALRELDEFAAAVEAIYPPGCKVWIVSDGHVFSDCSKYRLGSHNLTSRALIELVGVDDEMVDRYSEALISMYRGIKQSTPGKDRVGFHSLASLFSLDATEPKFDPSDVESLDLPHFNHTKLTDEAEFARKLLTYGFQIDGNALRSKIDSQDKSLLSLYRGFSRFMLEDLALHPRTAGMSKKQSKKLSSNIAFEMIKVGEMMTLRKTTADI